MVIKNNIAAGIRLDESAVEKRLPKHAPSFENGSKGRNSYWSLIGPIGSRDSLADDDQGKEKPQRDSHTSAQPAHPRVR